MAPNMEVAEPTQDTMTHVQNSHIRDMTSDVLFHIGLQCSTEERQQIIDTFGDVKFFVTGGSAERMTHFAHAIAKELGISTPYGYALNPIGSTSRYTLYKVGPVLVANHGIGMPSISILLHEVTKLLDYAKASNATYIRMGTSGGIGVEPGTVVITSEGVNNKMESVDEVAVLGSTVRRPAICSPEVREEIIAAAEEVGLPYAVGKTLSCNDFYEGQGRLDGAICEYTLEDKMAFLQKCADAGVRNIEMEARGMAGFCHKLNIPLAVVCVTLLNRLNGDQVLSSHETLQGFEKRPAAVLLHYIKSKLNASAMSSSRPSRPICFQSQWVASGLRTNVSVSGISDIGGASNSENQDAFFSFYDPKNAALVVGLFDGHGRDTGRDVAMAAKRYFEAQFMGYSQEDYARLEQDPKVFFQQLFETCHNELKYVLRGLYERSGHIVEEHQPEGFLVRQDARTGVIANVRGGTTATIVVVLNGGQKIYTSNVGDSAALMTALNPVLRSTDVKVHGLQNKLLVIEDAEHDDNNRRPSKSELLLLSGNHGPDCATEFVRAREARCNPLDTSIPALRFVYDSSEPRTSRLPIFTMSSKGELHRNPSGDYYKNVRDEWATLVSTPFTALFPDALAFTRSLGDFHMHSYGVCCEPTVMELSLERVVSRDLGFSVPHDWDNQEDHVSDTVDGNDESYLSSNNDHEEQQGETTTFMLVVASDGIWDNWAYRDLWSFLCESHSTKCLQQDCALSGDDDSLPIDAMVSSLMTANLQRARSSFGDQADNMTAVVIMFDLNGA
ncbi:hypothetical protein BBO99_00003979 [Phytophthora kernoviae]|uniref:PPM-type phosphatase domain-containing protein n=1 Tax=Phytophthora kernoviae TaxID=325452 RepID=A0A3R7ILC7_9STRA|nr:hypothetical protein BBI17_004010 [Phytophthora kernoviae]RLN81097.1 hypothetical protein BBO99_00003979 [Phytophthora kernoviae]